MLVFHKGLYKLLLNSNFMCISIRRVFVKVVEYIKFKSRIINYSNNYKVLLLNHFVVLVQFSIYRSRSLSKGGICSKIGSQKL
jgi:hypothetical protein